MELPKVSVIVPSYNHGRYLRSASDSIFAQTYCDLETIVLDDASTDDSQGRLPNITAGCGADGCQCGQRRLGVSAMEPRHFVARGEYVWIAESDDAADPRFLETLVPLLDENPAVGLAYCASKLIDGEGSHVGDSFGSYFDLDPTRWTAAYTNNGVDEVRRY